MKIFSSYVLCALMVLSCKHQPEYPGFSKGKHSIYYKLLKFGEETLKPKPGDYITADITYETMNDSVFFSGRRKLQITKPAFDGSIDECFMMLSEKEAATFIISAPGFFHQTLQTDLPSFFDENSKMKVTLEIIEIQTKEEFQKEKEAFIRWVEDFGEYEKVVLKQFLEQQKINARPTESGLLKIVINNGHGGLIQLNDTITINYEGKFLNGKFFDSTKKRNQPFQFVYGTEWQVVKGLEEALGTMREGEKSLFILPSELAFGQEGSSTGIIPPYTSLIFEVEVISVKKGN